MGGRGWLGRRGARVGEELGGVVSILMTMVMWMTTMLESLDNNSTNRMNNTYHTSTTN